MIKVKNTIAFILALLSAYMAINGLWIFVKTSGVIQGSEFGMLIALVNQISLIMLWLAIFTLWRLVPSGKTKDQG